MNERSFGHASKFVNFDRAHWLIRGLCRLRPGDVLSGFLDNAFQAFERVLGSPVLARPPGVGLEMDQVGQ